VHAKTKQGVDSAICAGMSGFELEKTQDIHAHLIGELLAVRALANFIESSNRKLRSDVRVRVFFADD